MEPKKNNWQIALSNLGAVYFSACLGSNAPFVFTLIGFLLFVFVSMPVMMKKAFRKIPLEEINILTPEQEDKIYNSKQTIKMHYKHHPYNDNYILRRTEKISSR